MAHMLAKHKEDKHALPIEVLNPVPWTMADAYFNPQGGVEGWLTNETMAVHLYASAIRRYHKRVVPMPGSYLANFAEKIDFDFNRTGLRNPHKTGMLH